MTDKTKTFGDLEIELSDAKRLLSEYEEKARLQLISNIKKFGDKYSNEELKTKPLNELEVISDALSRFGDALHVSAEPLPMGNTPEKKEKQDYNTATMFDSVLKEFNMSNISNKKKGQ